MIPKDRVHEALALGNPADELAALRARRALAGVTAQRTRQASDQSRTRTRVRIPSKAWDSTFDDLPPAA